MKKNQINAETAPAFQRDSSIQPAYDKITEYLEEHKSASRKELELHLNLGTTRTATLLKEMTELGLVAKNGSGKLTRYSLK